MLESEEDRQEIVQRLYNDPQGFADKRMLRCQSPGGDCPAPFEAFICPDRDSAHAFVEQIPTWALRRAFRLHKLNHQSRWPEYVAVICCTKPVARQRYIELERLIDRTLLSRSIVGMAEEVGAPITVYAAKFFEVYGKVHKFWIPVEAYHPDRPHIPPRYNLFCEECREATIGPLLDKFDGSVSTESCPIGFGRDGLCAGGEAACEEGDWNRCPAFLQARRDHGLCYLSYQQIIDELERKWGQNELKEPKNERWHCWAGFREIAVPIVVHDHLVAVAMSGQIVERRSKLPDVPTLVKEHKLLAPGEARLESLVQLLGGQRPPRDDRERHTLGFCLTQKEIAERAGLLQKNIARIVLAATAHYGHKRARSEAVFRHELLSHVNSPSSSPVWYEDLLLTVLERMREFWAFKATYLLRWEHGAGRLSATARSTQSAPGLVFSDGEKVLGTIKGGPAQTHPLPYLFDIARQVSPPNTWVRRFGDILMNARVDPDLQIPPGHVYFLVSIPFADESYAFVFAVRDNEVVSPLRRLLTAGISEICQEAILETTTAVAHALRELYQRFAREEHIKYDAWRRLSERVAHKIGNRVFAALGAHRRLKPAITDKAGDALDKIQRCLVQINRACNDFKRFSRLPPTRFEQTNIAALVREELREHQGDLGDRFVDADIASDLPTCTWDGDQIRYALAELLDNAVHHTADRDALRIKVHRADEDDPPSIRILIENPGVGIDTSLKDKVYEPFFTTRPDGSGLGLAIVHQIVTQHGGKIREDGEPGRYARFVIELPVHPEME